MDRRGFLSKIPAIAAAPFMLSGIPINLLANNQLQRLAASAAANDRVLVLIQLHGGNDGLNAVIPLDQYSQYFNLRPNIAISDKGSRKYINLDSTLPIANQVGLHPDMVGFKNLYDTGKAAIIQGVTYPNSNGSHFRSRDIWYIGGGYDDYWGSGWMGRFLSTEFPNFPEGYPSDDNPHPPAIEIGTTVSLGFHQEAGIPLAIAMDNPDEFFNLIKETGIDAPELLKETHYWKELEWITKIDDKSNVYADRLKVVYEKSAKTTVQYPSIYPYNAPKGSLDNPLSSQLKMIARLIAGGCKTRIYLAKMGGFDTHANQVESYDSSMGHHAALMYHLFSAMKAFQDDLKDRGLEDRVLSATFSEFGRRAKSNGSYGTDHGAAAPMFVFGKWVKPGIIGTNPDLNNLDGGNLPLQNDYRQVFTTILQDWMGADTTTLQSTKLDSFADKKLDLVQNWPLASDTKFVTERFKLMDCAPNPAKGFTTISYYINTAMHVSLDLFTGDGRLLKKLVDEKKEVGEHKIQVDLTGLPSGMYVYKVKSGMFEKAKKLIVIK
jgi:uncharacterized protein (DUF1501 family)